MKFIFLFLVTLTFVGLVTTQVIAQDEESFWNAPWEFNVNLYGWLPDAPATISVGAKEIADVPEDLSTILDSLEMAAMFELQLRKGRVTLFANNVYYKGDYDDNFIGPSTGLRREYELEGEVWAIRYGVGYGYGGESTVSGVDKNDRRENLAWALSAGYSFTRQLGVKTLI